MLGVVAMLSLFVGACSATKLRYIRYAVFGVTCCLLAIFSTYAVLSIIDATMDEEGLVFEWRTNLGSIAMFGVLFYQLGYCVLIARCMGRVPNRRGKRLGYVTGVGIAAFVAGVTLCVAVAPKLTQEIGDCFLLAILGLFVLSLWTSLYACRCLLRVDRMRKTWQDEPSTS